MSRWDITVQTKSMADRRSTYVFGRYEDYEDAKEHLHEVMYHDYYDSDCIYDFGSWGSDCWRIDIYSECSDAPRAADILREHRGRWYKVD